jgi:ribose transport system substrate-binding protein
MVTAACSTDEGAAAGSPAPVGEGTPERPAAPYAPSDETGDKPDLPQAAAAAMNVVNTEVFAATSKAMEAAADEAGLSFTETVADGDAAKNIDQLNSLSNKGVGAVFVWDVDVAAQRPVVKQLMDSGAAVFTLSSGPSTSPMVANQAEIGAQIGRAASDYINEELGGEANVVLFNLDKLPNIKPRFDAIREELAKTPGAEVVADVLWDTADPDSGFKSMSSLLQKDPDVDVVIGTDPVVVSALRAFEAADISTDDLALFGSDGAPEALKLIREGGPYKATYAFNFPILGYAAGAWGADWLAGRQIPALTVIKAVPLTSADAIDAYEADVADPAAAFENNMDAYLEPLGNISYETRGDYWNSENPQ